MSGQIENEQRITQYLLGSLSEAETEALDELSITDDEFADALEAAERDLVDAYVQGELDGGQLERFRTYYLASPLRGEKVAFAQALSVFAENAAAPAAEILKKSSAPVKPKGSGWFSALSVFTTPRWAPRWGSAAVALALLIAGGWLVFENVRLRQQMSKTQARHDQLLQREHELQKEIEAQRSANSASEQELGRARDERKRLEQELERARSGAVSRPSPGEGSIVSLVLAPPIRGTGQIPTVTVSPSTKLLAARLQLEISGYSIYRAALIDPASNRTLWRSGNLKPSTKGERPAIGVSFRADLLKPGNYILRVTGITASAGTEIVSDYPFKVVK